MSIGGAGNDTFVFHPGMGAETINNFDPQAGTSSSITSPTCSNWRPRHGPDAHGDAMIELGHNDSIAIPGMTPSYLQAHLQSMVHLHLRQGRSPG